MALDIQLRTAQPIDLAGEVLVVGVAQAGPKVPALPPSLKAIDAALGDTLSKLAAKEEFTGKRDQMLAVATLGRIPADKIILLGLGDRRSIGAPAARAFAAKAARAANGERAKSLALALSRGPRCAPARGGRGPPEARRLPLHEVPDGGSQAQDRAGDGRRRRRGQAQAQREGARDPRPEGRRGGQPVARSQQRAGQRDLPRVARGRGAGRRQGSFFGDRGLRLQGGSAAAAWKLYRRQPSAAAAATSRASCT